MQLDRGRDSTPLVSVEDVTSHTGPSFSLITQASPWPRAAGAAGRRRGRVGAPGKLVLLCLGPVGPRGRWNII